MTSAGVLRSQRQVGLYPPAISTDSDETVDDGGMMFIQPEFGMDKDRGESVFWRNATPGTETPEQHSAICADDKGEIDQVPLNAFCLPTVISFYWKNLLIREQQHFLVHCWGQPDEVICLHRFCLRL